ncbi:Smyd1 [Symbiodinium natans]|uniref:Smyd1 protein n=1 Tax=Symbiodinium natans TaxID=878477 RepID=A0A812IAU0_9DINO|nr:Smyd1 [Symbiodinium natans]
MAVVPLPLCDKCDKEFEKLLQCGYKMAFLCLRECQNNAWKRHKNICRKRKIGTTSILRGRLRHCSSVKEAEDEFASALRLGEEELMKEVIMALLQRGMSNSASVDQLDLADNHFHAGILQQNPPEACALQDGDLDIFEPAVRRVAREWLHHSRRSAGPDPWAVEDGAAYRVCVDEDDRVLSSPSGNGDVPLKDVLPEVRCLIF